MNRMILTSLATTTMGLAALAPTGLGAQVTLTDQGQGTALLVPQAGAFAVAVAQPREAQVDAPEIGVAFQGPTTCIEPAQGAAPGTYTMDATSQDPQLDAAARGRLAGLLADMDNRVRSAADPGLEQAATQVAAWQLTGQITAGTRLRMSPSDARLGARVAELVARPGVTLDQAVNAAGPQGTLCAGATGQVTLTAAPGQSLRVEAQGSTRTVVVPAGGQVSVPVTYATPGTYRVEVTGTRARLVTLRSAQVQDQAILVTDQVRAQVVVVVRDCTPAVVQAPPVERPGAPAPVVERPNAPAPAPARAKQRVVPGALSLTKTAPARVRAGQAFTYRLVVRNTGRGTVTGVRVTDALPKGLVYVSGGRRSGASVEFTRAALAPGAHTTFTFRVRAAAGAGCITNVAYATGQGALPASRARPARAWRAPRRTRSASRGNPGPGRRTEERQDHEGPHCHRHGAAGAFAHLRPVPGTRCPRTTHNNIGGPVMDNRDNPTYGPTIQALARLEDTMMLIERVLDVTRSGVHHQVAGDAEHHLEAAKVLLERIAQEVLVGGPVKRPGGFTDPTGTRRIITEVMLVKDATTRGVWAYVRCGTVVFAVRAHEGRLYWCERPATLPRALTGTRLGYDRPAGFVIQEGGLVADQTELYEALRLHLAGHRWLTLHGVSRLTLVF